MTELLDRETVEAFVEAAERVPRQATLDALAAQVDRARFLAGGLGHRSLDSRVLLDVSGDEARALVARLRIVEDGQLWHCMCLAAPTIELWAGGAVVAAIGLHHATSIRWSEVWAGDGTLVDPDALCEWLAARGVPGPLLEREEAREDASEADEAAERWMAAAPACLADRRDLLLPSDDEAPKAGELREVLTRGIPDPVEQVRALFTLYGAGSDPRGGITMGAAAVHDVLLGYEAHVLEAAASSALDARGLLGAAWLLSDSVFVGARYAETLARPAAVKAKLLGAGLGPDDAELFFGDGLAAIFRDAPDAVRPELTAMFTGPARRDPAMTERILSRAPDREALAGAMLDFIHMARRTWLAFDGHAVLERLPDAVVAAAAERSPEAFAAFAGYLKRRRTGRAPGLAIPEDLRARLITRTEATFEAGPMRTMVKGVLEKAP